MHALNSEHAKYALWFFANAYWLEWTEYVLCICQLSLLILRHTNQNLQWDSCHNLAAKYSVLSILAHRVKVVCTGPELLTEDLQHFRRVLTKCEYPKWMLDKVERKIFNSQEDSNMQGENPEDGTSNPSGYITGRDPSKDKHSEVT